MAKKHKGGKGGEKGVKGPKKPKVKKIPPVGEGLSPEEMTAGQLMGHIKRLLAEKDRELDERNIFMLEKNKLWALWQLAVDKVKTLKDDANHMDVKLEESRKERGKENDMFNQKLRMLQGEEIMKFGMVRLNHLNYMRQISDDIWAIENILRESSLSKKKSLRKQLASFYEIIRGLRLSHTKSVSDMYETLSRTIGFHVSGQDRTFFDRKSSWEESYLPMMEQLRVNKMERLDMTNLAHEQTLLEMKTFFDDVTTNNLAVMTMLAEEIDTQKLYDNRLKRDLRWAKANYRNVHIPLQKMIEDLRFWEANQKNSYELCRQLRQNEQALKSKEHCLHMLEVTNECARQQITIADMERDKSRVAFSKAAREMQCKAQMKSLLYQLKTKAACKDQDLFSTLSKEIIKPHLDKTDYFKKLTHQRDILMQEYRQARKTVFENYAANPKELACIEQQEAVNIGSVGLVNRRGCIRQPWRKLQRIYHSGAKSVRPRYKDILDTKNIFNQLPQIVPKTTPGSSRSTSRPSTSKNRTMSKRLSTAPIVSIFPPKSLQLIKSREQTHASDKSTCTGDGSKNGGDGRITSTKQKLMHLLHRVRYGEDAQGPPPCEFPYLQVAKHKSGHPQSQFISATDLAVNNSSSQVKDQNSRSTKQTTDNGRSVKSRKDKEFNPDLCKSKKDGKDHYLLPKSQCLQSRYSTAFKK